MKINEKGYVLENEDLPIKFLCRCYPEESSHVEIDNQLINGWKLSDFIKDGLYTTEKEANIDLQIYNDATFHRNVPQFRIREVDVTYEI